MTKDDQIHQNSRIKTVVIAGILKQLQLREDGTTSTFFIRVYKCTSHHFVSHTDVCDITSLSLIRFGRCKFSYNAFLNRDFFQAI